MQNVVGDQVRQIRSSRGWSQAGLAATCQPVILQQYHFFILLVLVCSIQNLVIHVFPTQVSQRKAEPFGV